jgi:hypothetical protein
MADFNRLNGMYSKDGDRQIHYQVNFPILVYNYTYMYSNVLSVCLKT